MVRQALVKVCEDHGRRCDLGLGAFHVVGCGMGGFDE